MKQMGIAKQMSWLMTGLIGLTIGGVGMEAYLLSSASRDARASEARLIERSRQQFGLVRELGAVQTLAQKVVRERDPDELEKAVERYKAIDAAAHKMVKEMGEAQVAAALDRLGEVNGRILEAVLSGDNADAARLLIEEGGPKNAELMAVLSEAQQTWAKASEEESKRAGDRQAALNMGAVVVALVLTVVMGFVAAMIVKRLKRQLQEAMDRLSQGADQMTNATSQISSVSQSLASSASEQVAAMEKTTGATRELHAEIHGNSERSRDAAALMGKTAAAVEDADARLGEMTSAMQAIATSSGRISQIIRTIDEIAFQTNILALNAAVEAARAGEAGMGFAVVADEVRNLAQRAAQAARDTTALIEESLAHSKEGTGKFQLVEASTRAIEESAARAKGLVDDVQRSGGAQTRSIDEIARALSEIESLTQHTATSAEESAAAAEELSAQAEELRHVVRGIEELVG